MIFMLRAEATVRSARTIAMERTMLVSIALQVSFYVWSFCHLLCSWKKMRGRIENRRRPIRGQTTRKVRECGLWREKRWESRKQAEMAENKKMRDHKKGERAWITMGHQWTDYRQTSIPSKASSVITAPSPPHTLSRVRERRNSMQKTGGWRRFGALPNMKHKLDV